MQSMILYWRKTLFKNTQLWSHVIEVEIQLRYVIRDKIQSETNSVWNKNSVWENIWEFFFCQNFFFKEIFFLTFFFSKKFFLKKFCQKKSSFFLKKKILVEKKLSEKIFYRKKFCQEKNSWIFSRTEFSWFPLGLEIRGNLEKWEGIFKVGKSRGILSRLEKSGNFTQNTGKTMLENLKEYWKSQGNLSANNSENPANMVPYFK